MIEAQEAHEQRARTAGARADFVANLGRRLDALRGALAALEEEPRSASRRNNLQRRVHAMGAAAHVLGFESVAEALSGAEQALQRSVRGGAVTGAHELAEVVARPRPAAVAGLGRRRLESGRRLRRISSRRVRWPLGRTWPISVLVFGDATMAEGLEVDNERDELEAESTRDAVRGATAGARAGSGCHRHRRRSAGRSRAHRDTGARPACGAGSAGRGRAL